MARYEIEKYRTIEATLDLANDYAPPIRLNAGDLDGRVLKFNITDGGNDVDDLNGLSARLTWNRDPTDPNSGGGFTDMTKTAGTDNPTGVYRVSFTAPVPRSLLQDAGEHTVLGIDIEDADGGIISSRNIPVMVEPARVNPKAPEIADPLKDLHDTIDGAKQMIAEASIDIGTVTTLAPAKKATSALTGTGLKRKLNLGIPRGSKISSVTATALDAATPTVNTSTDANGDTIIALGLPRGKQGEKGDKGDPGDAGGLATADKAGIVKPGNGLTVSTDGTLSATGAGTLPILWTTGFRAFFVFCGRFSQEELNKMVADAKNVALELGIAQVRGDYTIPVGEKLVLTVEGNLPAIPANENPICSVTFIPIMAAEYQKTININATRAAVTAGATEISWTATESKDIPIGTYIVHATG